MRFKHRKRVRKKRLQTRHDRIMTLANAISISRIFLAIPLVLVFEDIAQGAAEKLWQAFVLIIIIALSDFLDGYVARKAEEITNFGKLIDPVADKVCMMVVLIYLIIFCLLWLSGIHSSLLLGYIWFIHRMKCSNLIDQENGLLAFPLWWWHYFYSVSR